MPDNISEKILLIVGRLEGKMDGMNTRLDRMNGSIANHEDRINENESSIDQSKGKSTAYGVIAGVVTALFGSLIAYFKLKK